ncbi:MAG: hypothetical protein K8R07_04990, partial [Desulfobacterales bacterium]|nr:hypothetical protein [Desulfobacterales bacterium]
QRACAVQARTYYCFKKRGLFPKIGNTWGGKAESPCRKILDFGLQIADFGFVVSLRSTIFL